MIETWPWRSTICRDILESNPTKGAWLKQFKINMEEIFATKRFRHQRWFFAIAFVVDTFLLLWILWYVERKRSPFSHCVSRFESPDIAPLSL